MMILVLSIISLCVIGSLCCSLLIFLGTIIKKYFKFKVSRRGTKKDIIIALAGVNCAVFILVISSMVTNAYPDLYKNDWFMEGEIKEISVQGVEHKKTVDEIFSQSSKNKKDEKEALNGEIAKCLHKDWMEENLSYEEYGKKIADLYFRIPYREEEASQQNDEAEKLHAYNKVISKVQDKRKKKEVITEDELWEERQAYWQSFLLRPMARMAYQAGRTSEDIFWLQECSDDFYKSGAEAIHSFEVFIEFKNREVGEGKNKRTVHVEEILFRNGKTYYQMGIVTKDKAEKVHYLLCAYGAFSNINLEGENVLDCDANNEYVLLAEYYKGLTIANLPLDQVDEYLLEELRDSIYIANTLLERNAAHEDVGRQKEETNMLELLEGLEFSVRKIERWIN